MYILIRIVVSIRNDVGLAETNTCAKRHLRWLSHLARVNKCCQAMN